MFGNDLLLISKLSLIIKYLKRLLLSDAKLIIAGFKSPFCHICREAIWGACVTALCTVPRLLRIVLQSLHVGDLNEEELPQLGQILSMLLQHTQLHSQLLANTALLQEIIQHLTVNTQHTHIYRFMHFETAFVDFDHLTIYSARVLFRGTRGVRPGSSG